MVPASALKSMRRGASLYIAALLKAAVEAVTAADCAQQGALGLYKPPPTQTRLAT